MNNRQKAFSSLHTCFSFQNPWAEWDSFENFDQEFDEIGTQPNSSNGVDIWNPIVSMFLPMSNVNIDMLEKWSDDFYPELYCGCIEATETACYEQNIVELWGDQVAEDLGSGLLSWISGPLQREVKREDSVLDTS